MEPARQHGQPFAHAVGGHGQPRADERRDGDDRQGYLGQRVFIQQLIFGGGNGRVDRNCMMFLGNRLDGLHDRYLN